MYSHDSHDSHDSVGLGIKLVLDLRRTEGVWCGQTVMTVLGLILGWGLLEAQWILGHEIKGGPIVGLISKVGLKGFA